MKPLKAPKPLKNAHTSNAKKGMGDYYGTGVRNKLGKIVDGFGMNQVSKNKLRTPPRGLA